MSVCVCVSVCVCGSVRYVGVLIFIYILSKGLLYTHKLDNVTSSS